MGAAGDSPIACEHAAADTDAVGDAAGSAESQACAQARASQTEGWVGTLSVAWLRHLVRYGETCWSRMPPKINSNRAVSNQTWQPMIDHGLITGELKAPDPAKPKDWWFNITQAGREALQRDEQDSL